MRDYPGDRVDLRSDTVTQPTPPMREAMAKSLGIDVQKLKYRVILLAECLSVLGLFLLLEIGRAHV